MSVKTLILISISSFLFLFSVSLPSSAEEVRIHGAASVADRVATPYKNAVEKTTGYQLTIVVSNAGKGLIDLVDGKCDASMASASPETVAKAAAAAGKNIDSSKLSFHVIDSDEIVFVVHQSNPVTDLTIEQVRDIHTGKIRNWKDAGGKDMPIVVFTDSLPSATRGLIRDVVLGGADYSAQAIAVDAVKQVNDRVAVTEGGIGGLGKGFVDLGTVKIIRTKMIERPLGFITIGEPSEKVKKVIEAYRTSVRGKTGK